MAAVALILALVFGASFIDAQLVWMPADGDSCTSFRGVDSSSQTQVGPISCAAGMVITSAGECVSPNDPRADRCRNAADFTEQTVNEICNAFPSMVFADPLNCSNYYDCRLQQQMRHRQCALSMGAAQMFDDIQKTCRPAVDVQCGERRVNYTVGQLTQICQNNPARIIVNSANCNSYFDCSKTTGYYTECQYSALFNAETKQCEPADNVQCNKRPEIKDACVLDQMQCRSIHCRPCQFDYPNCENLADGNQPLDTLLYTPRFAKCLQGRSLGVSSCQNVVNGRGLTQQQLFNAQTKKCESAETIPRSLGGIAAEG